VAYFSPVILIFSRLGRLRVAPFSPMPAGNPSARQDMQPSESNGQRNGKATERDATAARHPGSSRPIMAAEILDLLSNECQR
jgi:hypothetical protein